MPVARADLELLLHFAHRSAIDKHLSDNAPVEVARHADPQENLATCPICGFRTRDERYLMLHGRRRDHRTMLLLPLKKRKWMRLCDPGAQG
jgi:hypothetical protein